jgi:hypothetical protein
LTGVPLNLSCPKHWNRGSQVLLGSVDCLHCQQFGAHPCHLQAIAIKSLLRTWNLLFSCKRLKELDQFAGESLQTLMIYISLETVPSHCFHSRLVR